MVETRTPSNPQVLIVGAGPTGLALALWLHRLGVPFRIVDKAPAPGLASRALAVHARTLEFYAQLGFADEVIAQGIIARGMELRLDRPRVAEVTVAGEGTTPYPFVLIFAQDDHERLLVEQLRRRGVEVERGVELAEVEDDGARVRATLKTGETTETVEVAYLCGCDGAHSVTRHQTPARFQGAPYREVFFVADARVTGDAAGQTPTLCLDADGLDLIVPVRRTGTWRVIGMTPADRQDRLSLGWSDVEAEVRRRTGLMVEKVEWFSIYHVHHRVADRFRWGRVFLLGDAAHIHSPVGGQGMNTGIGDAVNLAWKLADVLSGRATPGLLDSYDPERRGFARRLVATTDRLFRIAADRGPAGRLWRTTLMPAVLPLLAGAAAMRRQAFRLISQTGIAYPTSPLSAGGAGQVRGGDRLPWVKSEGVDPYATLQACDWRIHVHGAARPALAETANAHGLALDVFAWTREAQRAGYKRDALYLVRPDGHVAFAEPNQDAAALAGYLRRTGLARPTTSAGPGPE